MKIKDHKKAGSAFQHNKNIIYYRIHVTSFRSSNQESKFHGEDLNITIKQTKKG